MPVPDPPDLTKREPLVETWPAGKTLYRVHRATHHPNEFNSEGTVSRFRPFRSGSRRVATLYAANGPPAALTETVFHDLRPEVEDQILLRSVLFGRVRSIVTASRDLNLISLRGAGLRRLRTSAAALIHTSPDDYPATADFALALYRWPGRADGIIWDSRLYPGSPVVMLFGPRVRPTSLSFSYDTIEPLWKGAGFDEVLSAAEEAGITIVM